MTNIFHFFFVLIQRSKNQDLTKLAKNPKLTLKSFNSAHTPERFLNALTADFLYANSVMSFRKGGLDINAAAFYD
jgi:hypothetical protein